MRLVFRSDATPKIGTGHVMRSSAIAEEAISRGIRCIFVGDVKGFPWVENRLKDIGFSQIVNDPNIFKSNAKSDILIIDTYETSVIKDFLFTNSWLKVVNIFDSLTPGFECDLRIHPGLSTNWLNLGKEITLSGPDYIPIRKSITREFKPNESNPIEILVVGGGADSTNFVLAVAGELAPVKKEFNVRLFTRHAKPDSLDYRFAVNAIGNDLDLIANRADLIFSTASTTSLEFIARGSAVAIGCAADNQEQYYSELALGNFAHPIGEFKDKWIFKSKSIFEIVESESLRRNLKVQTSGLIDFLGSQRSMDQIQNLIV
jgi:spore coat polysaccharide biosynthesis predicted glycosyltransferase SpsG